MTGRGSPESAGCGKTIISSRNDRMTTIATNNGSFDFKLRRVVRRTRPSARQTYTVQVLSGDGHIGITWLRIVVIRWEVEASCGLPVG